MKRLRSRRLRTPLFLEPILWAGHPQAAVAGIEFVANQPKPSRLVISVDGESCQWSGDFTHHFRWAMPHICS